VRVFAIKVSKKETTSAKVSVAENREYLQRRRAYYKAIYFYALDFFPYLNISLDDNSLICSIYDLLFTVCKPDHFKNDPSLPACIKCGPNTDDSIRGRTFCQCKQLPIRYHRYKAEKGMSEKPCYRECSACLNVMFQPFKDQASSRKVAFSPS